MIFSDKEANVTAEAESVLINNKNIIMSSEDKYHIFKKISSEDCSDVVRCAEYWALLVENWDGMCVTSREYVEYWLYYNHYVNISFMSVLNI